MALLLAHLTCLEGMLALTPAHEQPHASLRTFMPIRFIVTALPDTPATSNTLSIRMLAPPLPIKHIAPTLSPMTRNTPALAQPQTDESASKLAEDRSASPVEVNEPNDFPKSDLSADAMFDSGSYLPSAALDRRPTPVSEPDIDVLQGLNTSGLPVRLKIYIDRSGRVMEVMKLQASLLDEEFALGLRRMFLETAFIPGRLYGEDVASYIDIELVGR